ncbi:MAG: hypothetical protein ACXVZV_01820 [Terriglobales bacterium]
MINPDGSRIKSRFNDLGQRIEEDRYDGSGKLAETTTYIYETDDHGNWTRRTTTRSSEPGSVTVTIRTFTYY